MAKESFERGPDTQETTEHKPMIVQIGSKRGAERDTRGDLKAGNLVGISEGDKNGNVLGTLQGNTLMRKITEMVARHDLDTDEGGKELIIDLARAQNVVKEEGLSEQDLSDAEVLEIVALRDTLKRTKDITLTLTGLKPETERRLRAAGMLQKDLQMVTKSNTAKVLGEKARKTETPMDQAA